MIREELQSPSHMCIGVIEAGSVYESYSPTIFQHYSDLLDL